MKQQQVQLGLTATSYGLGPFHPAFSIHGTVWYWPNITMDTEEEAVHRARLALNDAEQAAQDVIHEWNVVPAA